MQPTKSKACGLAFVLQNLPAGKEYFNFKLSSARMHVEQAFGLLKNRWRMLFGAVLHNPTILPLVVTAACILHNLLIDQGDNVMQFLPPGTLEMEAERYKHAHAVHVEDAPVEQRLLGTELWEKVFKYMGVDRR